MSSQAERTRIRNSVHEIVFGHLEGQISNAEMNRRLNKLFGTHSADTGTTRRELDRKTMAAGDYEEDEYGSHS
jgi:hypothetical protein